MCDSDSTITNSSRILKIIMSNYSLSGYLGEEISLLSALQGLYLDNNSLHGPIPSSFNNMLNLEWLHLENNQLEGSIPDLSNDKQLTDLFLQSNQLTGTVPTSLGTLPKLTQLYLQNNMLSGTLGFSSTVPNSTYRFAPQRNPPASPTPSQSPGLTSFNPIFLPAVLSAAGLLLVCGALVWAFRRNRRQQKEKDQVEMHSIHSVHSEHTSCESLEDVDGQTREELIVAEVLPVDGATKDQD